MKLKNTIFILGAGASKPYGYPTAEELREKLINKYNEIITVMIDGIPSLKKDKVNFSNDIYKLITQFSLSNTNSIDLFLTRNKKNVDKELGKGLILLSILWYELISTLRSKIREEDWYFEFFNELTSDILNKEELLKLTENKIHFITFNYDRSLENFLYESFKNSFSLSPIETRQIMTDIFEFHHVYGKIAALDWESDNVSLSYKGTPDEKIYQNPRSINLIYDERKVNDLIQNLIYKSRTIFFLGFGFAEANVEFLNLKELLTKQHDIYATGIGLYDRRINNIKDQLRKGTFGIYDDHIHIDQESNCLQLLQKHLF